MHENSISLPQGKNMVSTPREFLITQQHKPLSLQLANMMNEDDTTNTHWETTHIHSQSFIYIHTRSQYVKWLHFTSLSTFSQSSLFASFPRFLLMPTEKLNAHTKVTQKIYLAGISFTPVYHTFSTLSLSLSFLISLACG